MIILFFIISLINVYLQNIKTIMLLKSNKLTTAVTTMVTAIFYSSVVKMISINEWLSTLIIIAITHFIGVYLAMSSFDWLNNKINRNA